VALRGPRWRVKTAAAGIRGGAASLDTA